MLEATPHNNVHPFVGGDMGGFHSPLDAVFWGHHNMLDCLWTEWNIDRQNPNTNDPAWNGLHFTEFVDENGAPADVTAGITVLFPILSYQFESCSAVQAGAARKKFNAKALEQFLRAGAPVKFDISKRIELQGVVEAEVGKPIRSVAKIEAEAFRTVLESTANSAALLKVDGADVPDKTDFYVRVFLGLPGAGAETSIDDPHFAGSFGFFQDGKAMAGMPMQEKLGYLIDISPTLRQLTAAGSLPSPLDVTLVTVPYGRESAAMGQRLKVDKLSLNIAAIK